MSIDKVISVLSNTWMSLCSGIKDFNLFPWKMWYLFLFSYYSPFHIKSCDNLKYFICFVSPLVEMDKARNASSLKINFQDLFILSHHMTKRLYNVFKTNFPKRMLYHLNCLLAKKAEGHWEGRKNDWLVSSLIACSF